MRCESIAVLWCADKNLGDTAPSFRAHKPPFAALFINDCNWCKWASRRLMLSIEKSCFRDKMRLPSSLVFLPCSRINFPCSLINRETACKALLLWYDSEPNQQKTANIDPKRTFFPVNSLLTGKITGKINKNSFHLILKSQFLLGKADFTSKFNRELN